MVCYAGMNIVKQSTDRVQLTIYGRKHGGTVFKWAYREW